MNTEKAELIAKLTKLKERISQGHDHEFAHMQADQLLLQYIWDPDITAAFNSISKWYG